MTTTGLGVHVRATNTPILLPEVHKFLHLGRVTGHDLLQALDVNTKDRVLLDLEAATSFLVLPRSWVQQIVDLRRTTALCYA